MSYRGSFQIGQALDLRTVFTDVDGAFMSADAEPTVYVYDNTVDDETRAAEVEAETFASATAVAATELSTGYYSAVIASLSVSEGICYEYWFATVDGANQTTLFTWTATAGAEVASQSPGNNTMVLIKIDGITDLATGEESVEEQLFYTTRYTPMYASPDMMRLELGEWISYIPDDTLALMLYWSSKEADFIQVKNCPDRIKYARAKFVLYDAALRAMMIPGHGRTAASLQGGRKSLGDLSISLGSPMTNSDLEDVFDRLRSERMKWFKVLQAGGCINPGQSYNPTFAVKGILDPDRRNTGRLWEDPREFYFRNPSVNEKHRRGARRRARWGLYPQYPKTQFYQDID